MSYLSLGDLQIAYQDRGRGPPLLAVHCSCASSREWGFLNSALEAQYRILEPDLLGYGRSPAWPLSAKTTTVNDGDVLEAILSLCSEPVHLLGHSYGAAVCLELALRYAEIDPGRIRSLFLIEPVAFHLLAATAGQESAWDEISQLGRRCISACEVGDNKRAASIFMGYWLGHIKWRLSPRRLKTEVIRTMPKVAYEFRGMFDYTPDIDAYRQIASPLTLIAGGKTRRSARAVIDVLGQLLPHTRTITIPGAGHMSPFSHKHEIIKQLRIHLAGYEEIGSA